jgi:histidinol-phosphate aminotransferase
MTLTRRSFLGALGAGSAATVLPFITARGMEPVSAGYREFMSSRPNPLGLPEIRLDSNENPYGPAPQALEAIQGMFSEACRYPDVSNERLISAIAHHLEVQDENILLGQGSSEILRVAVDTFTGPTRGLVTASPTFELPTNRARVLGVPVVETALAPGLLLDLDRMTDASASAGLVFLCNPNNPTATMHGPAAVKAALDRMLAASLDSVILVDEAYFEYVTRADHETMIPLALANPRIVVARTFSKVYGMAGLRVGYAVGQPATLARMARNVLVNNINVLAAAAAWTSLSVPGHAARQQARNTEVKGTTVRFFESRGYQVVPSEANFIMVDIRRPMQDFRQACRDRGVMVGRPFPPFDTHVRISIGTGEEMRQATEVFGQILQG